jgi:hypothetical protein
VADFSIVVPALLGEKPLAGVAQGVSNGQAQHHAFDSVKVQTFWHRAWRSIKYRASPQVNLTGPEQLLQEFLVCLHPLIPC